MYVCTVNFVDGDLELYTCAVTSITPWHTALMLCNSHFQSKFLTSINLLLEFNEYILFSTIGPAFTANPHVNCSYFDSNPNKMPNLVPRQIPALPIPGYRPYATTDACRNYKNLTSMDRSITYEDWSSYRCDMALFGWYRFINPAGIHMLNSCPQNSPGSLNSCGSYYKGWLRNQLLPSQQSGVVNRTVCFSKPYSCDCSYTREIKVTNCGSFYAYYLDAVPLCNARYCSKNGWLNYSLVLV